jgi:hypothetical protein
MVKFNEEYCDVFMSQMKEFLTELSRVFNDVQFVAEGKKYIYTMNEKYLMRNWKKYIGDPYGDEIEQMNINLLIKKVKENTTKIRDVQTKTFIELINHFDELSRDSKTNTMMYLSNITRICNAYFEK